MSSFFSIPIWKYLSRHDRQSDDWWERLKIGKVQAWVTMNAVTVVTNVMYVHYLTLTFWNRLCLCQRERYVLVPEHGLWYLYVCMMFNGIPIGGQVGGSMTTCVWYLASFCVVSHLQFLISAILAGKLLFKCADCSSWSWSDEFGLCHNI